MKKISINRVIKSFIWFFFSFALSHNSCTHDGVNGFATAKGGERGIMQWMNVEFLWTSKFLKQVTLVNFRVQFS